MLWKAFTSFALGLGLVSVPETSPGQLHRRGTNLTGDAQCGLGMCISAIVNASEVEYVLTYTYTKKPLGWIAMGFGTQMSNAQMVIMWPNTNSKNTTTSVTLSQRTATGEVMPTVDAHPQRTATFSHALSNFTGSQPQFAYTIPKNNATSQQVIWAYASTPPSSSAATATLQQHINEGQMTLDLSKTVTNASVPLPTSGAGGDSAQTMLVWHGILTSAGFVIFLPLGILLARFSRFAKFKWFTGHWIIQFAIAAPLIVAGIFLAWFASRSFGSGLPDTHKTLGKTLLGLYVVQVLLGAVIHFFKPKPGSRLSRVAVKGRPMQNYTHAVLGLLIVGLAFVQVRIGYREEWPEYVPATPVPGAVNVVYWIWLIVVTLAYISGLVTLKRQYQMERELREQKIQDQQQHPLQYMPLPNPYTNDTNYTNYTNF